VRHPIHPPRPCVELLESRRLLSGFTLITHGQGGSAGGEVARTADRIALRAGGAAQYVLTVEGSGIGGARVVSFVKDADSPSIASVRSGEMIIRLDYSDVNLLPTTTTAAVVADYLLSNDLVAQQLHLAGPSRGGSLVSNLAASLGRRGVWVDHVTYIDPVPADNVLPGIGAGFEGPMKVTDNVTFADNYWRSDNNLLTGFDGQHVNGAHEGNLNNTVQRDNDGDPHTGAGAYYIATIDPTEPIVEPARSSWFRGTADAPARNRTGYYFSRIVGGRRPGDGVHPLFGGAAHRDPTRRSPRSQWPNVADLAVVGQTHVTRGTTVRVGFRYGDADSAARVTLFLDPDRNPFNGNATRIGSGRLAATPGVAISRMSGATGGATPGAYYVYAQVVDGTGHVRYAYAKIRLTLTRPTPVRGPSEPERARITGVVARRAGGDGLLDDGDDRADPFAGLEVRGPSTVAGSPRVPVIGRGGSGSFFR
jgi:hypothetical protein